MLNSKQKTLVLCALCIAMVIASGISDYYAYLSKKLESETKMELEKERTRQLIESQKALTEQMAKTRNCIT